MLKIGNYNTLKVAREVDFGVYLATDDDREILLPARYVPDNARPGDELRVFVYTDSEDRLIATTEPPYATVGEFAYLQVRDVNATGAFLDWGVAGKDLLVPFNEQRSRMKRGGVYLVYVYLDDASKRVAASSKIDRFLGNVYPRYRHGQEVKALVIEHTPIGYKTIVDNLHRGMIYENEIFRPLEVEETVTAYVKGVREDGKIDLTLSDKARNRIGPLAARIMGALRAHGGVLAVGDRTDPGQIEALFSCSKKDFKKALGQLYKEGKIVPGPDETRLSDEN